MTERIAKLEACLAAVLPTLSTKAEYEGARKDVYKGQSDMKSWTIATSSVLLVGMFTIAAYFLNHMNAIVIDARHIHAETRHMQASQPVMQQPVAPIIIQLPAPQAGANDP